MTKSQTKGARFGFAILGAGLMLSVVPASAQVAPESPSQALSRHLKSLAANPQSLAPLMGAGQAALSLGDAQAALTFFGRAEEIAPRDGRIKMWMGSALVQLQQPQGALRFFEQALSLGAAEGEVAGERGLARDISGDPRGAQRDYRLALQKGANPEVTRRLALSLAISGEREPALRLLDDQLRVRNRDAERTRVLILALTGDSAGAARAVQASMPGGRGSAMTPFLERLAALNVAERALAVHLGVFPQSGRSAGPLPNTYASADPVAAGTTDPRQAGLGRTPDPRGRGTQLASREAAPVGPSSRVSWSAGSRALSSARRLPEKRSISKAPTNVVAAASVQPKDAKAAPVPAPPGETAKTEAKTPSVPAAAGEKGKGELAPAVTLAGSRSELSQAVPTAAAPAVVSPSSAQPVQLAQVAPQTSVAFPATQLPSVQVTAPQASVTQASATKTTTTVQVAPAAATPAPVTQAPVTQPAASAIVQATTATGAAPRPMELASADPAVAAPGFALLGGTAPEPAARPAEPPAAPADQAASTRLAEITATVAALPEVAPEPKPSPAKPAAKAPAPKPVATKPATASTKDARTGKTVLATKDDKTAKPAAGKTAATKGAAPAATKKAAAPAEPSRVWVQVAGGAEKAALPREFARLRSKAPKLLAARGAWTAPAKATNRLLVGPFKTEKEAQEFVNELAKSKLDGFAWTSEAGQKIEKLSAK